MKENEKRFIAILLVILVIVIIIIVARRKGNEENNNSEVSQNIVEEEFVTVLEDGTKLNKSEELSKAKMLGDLKFENIQLTNRNGQTVLLADVTNTGSTKTDMTLVKIAILDKNGNILGEPDGIIIPLEPGAKTQFNTTTMRDYANAYDFRITKK